MTVRSDKVLYTVTVDSVDVTSKVVLPLRASYGFDLRIAEASLRFRELPTGLTNWSTVQISMGRVGTGTTGNVQRFDGYCFDTTWELWPHTMQVPCKGPLIIADVARVPEDEYADQIPYGLPAVAEYLAPGIDLSVNPDTGANWRDSDMVTWVLTKCGLASKIVFIGGIGKYLGTIAFDQFIWRRGQSGLGYIEELDKIALGFRTYDTIAGIRRTQTSPRTPFLDDRIDTNEATHLLEGTVNTAQLAETANRIVVTGMDYGGYPMVAVETAGHVSPPPGLAYITYPFSSPMIELDEPDNVDNLGLSCREVAQWLIEEKNRRFYDVQIVTWQDNLFVPGNTVYVNAPHLAGPSIGTWSGSGILQSMWIRRVDTEIAENGAFTQRLHVRAADYYANDPAPTLPATLGLSMEVNP